jgi:hypothetical protein
MAQIPERPQGNGNVLQTDKQPEEAIKWVTPDEADGYNRILFKDFVRKSELKPGDNSKFIYRVTGMRPYTPLFHNGQSVTTNTLQNLVVFSVNKFYRNEFIKAKRRESGQEVEEDVNKSVTWTEYDAKAGNWITVDGDACFEMDSRVFLAQFKRDTQ